MTLAPSHRHTDSAEGMEAVAKMPSEISKSARTSSCTPGEGGKQEEGRAQRGALRDHKREITLRSLSR